jgi:hypothetical protein
MNVIIAILLVVGIGAALLCLPVLVFAGRKPDWGEPYYDLEGREWKIYRMPRGGDGGGAASGDPGGGGGHCGGDGGGH